MAELHIDDELKAWIDPLSPEEYAQLEANILAEGCRDPIVVWGGYILDGHNRYEICTRHNVKFSTVEKSGLVTKDDALVWMAQNQLGKRNLSDFTRVALALRLKPLLEQRAQERVFAGKAPELDPPQISAGGVGETREMLAKAAGVSRDTVRKVEKILESGNAEVAAQVRAGEISINAAAKKVSPPRPPIAAVAPLPDSPTNADAAAHPSSISPNSTLVAAQAPVAPVDEDSSAPLSEVEQLREQVAELAADLEKMIADNVEMGRVFEADDRLQAAMSEIARHKAAAASAKQSLDSKMGENNELIRTVKSLRGQLEREKKRADDAERQLAQMRSVA